jgi:tetratricopeptide (TPR) repeat protein
VVGALLLVAACSSTSIQRAERFGAQDEWLKAVLEYRKALAERPNDVETLSRLRRTELRAADFYYERGERLLEQGKFDEAIAQFQQGLTAMPDHPKLQQVMAETVARNEAGNLYQQGMTLRQAGKIDDARRQFQKALEVYPDHKQAAGALAELAREDAEKLSEGPARSPSSRARTRRSSRKGSPSPRRRR